MNKSNEFENRSIYLLKGIACIVVVFLHCPFPGILGDAIIYGVRFSVPVFFMTTGYYAYGKNRMWLIKQMKKVVLLIIQGEVFCGIVDLIIEVMQGHKEICNWLRELEIIKHPIKVLLFGSVCNGTLWYLYALFWTLVVLYFIEKYFTYYKFYYCLIPILMLVHIVGRAVLQNYGDINRTVFLFRSAALFGVPFVLFGHLIAEQENFLKKYIKEKESIIILIAGFGLEIVEFIFFHQYMDLHISTIVISFALFWWACMHSSEDYIPLLRIFGKKYSMWVYIVHGPFVKIVNEIIKNITIEKITLLCAWLKPIAVIAISLVLAVCIEWIKKNTENRFSKFETE